MGIGWFCYWGWPKPIADIWQWAVNELGDDEDPLRFGPAHIVWEDENFDCSGWCLENFDDYEGDLTDRELAIVRQSLEKLAAIDDRFTSEPDGYAENSDPAAFPPPRGWKMVKV